MRGGGLSSGPWVTAAVAAGKELRRLLALAASLRAQARRCGIWLGVLRSL